MTESYIAQQIFFKYGRPATAAHNMYLYPFESDVIILSKAGYITVYEIKLTRSDYFADFKKRKYISAIGATRTREYFLKSGHGPNRFYYVYPQGMIKPEEVPDYAGIIQVGESGINDIYRKAPRLHAKKAKPVLRDKILKAMYWKAWNNINCI